MRVIEEKPVSIEEVKKILTQRKKEGDLRYEQKITLKYAKTFSKLSHSKSEQLIKDLKDLKIAKLSEKHIIKVVDILPEDRDDLRTIFAKERFDLKPEDMDKILETIEKYK